MAFTENRVYMAVIDFDCIIAGIVIAKVRYLIQVCNTELIFFGLITKLWDCD